VIEVFATRIVGWRVSSSLATAFVLDALEQAIYDPRGAGGEPLVHHSDRGTQYLSMRYTDAWRRRASHRRSAVGAILYDNALAELIIGLFKTEVIQRKGPWRHLEAVEFATLTWVDWFNTRRLLEPIGYVPPAEHEARYYEDLRRHTTIDDSVPGGYSTLPRPTIVVPGGSCEVEFAPMHAEFTWVARFTRWRSPATTSRAAVLTQRPPSACMTFFKR
jgi:hypothetical protein